jgi:hypothetical protein
MTESRKCKNCYYSETIEVFNPVLSAFSKEVLEEFRLKSELLPNATMLENHNL